LEIPLWALPHIINNINNMIILNQSKTLFNPDYDLPVYVFEGTYEEYLELRKQEKVFLEARDETKINVWKVDTNIIVK
jgi:hypothetical protein